MTATRALRPLPELACAVLAALGALTGCAPTDRVARQDVESLQTNVQQMESSIQARQAGVYEQIRDLREEQHRLARLIEENDTQTRAVDTQLRLLSDRTGEEFERRGRASEEAVADMDSRLTARLDTLQKGVEVNDQNVQNLHAFVEKQEARIAKLPEQFQGQLQGQLNVLVQEVGKENEALRSTIDALRSDLDAVRQEAAASRQALVELQESMQQIAGRLAAAQEELQDLAKRQAAAAKAAAGGDQHTVRAGETLTAIAARYGVSVKTLMERNRISDADSIRVGQKLTIP